MNGNTSKKKTGLAGAEAPPATRTNPRRLHDEGLRIKPLAMTCCSQRGSAARNKNKPPPFARRGFADKAPGDDLLLHGLSHTTIGAAAFHFRVRDGIGWDHSAKFARELERVALVERGLGMGTWDVTFAFWCCCQTFRRGQLL